MDPKKQDLNPELKQIYERVMNTQVAKPAPAQGQAPSQATPASPVSQGGPSAAQPIPTAAQAPTGQVQPQVNSMSGGAPRPAPETKSFVFTGNKIITPQGSANATGTIQMKKGISGGVIAGLVVILVIVWGALWGKVFGLF